MTEPRPAMSDPLQDIQISVPPAEDALRFYVA